MRAGARPRPTGTARWRRQKRPADGLYRRSAVSIRRPAASPTGEFSDRAVGGVAEPVRLFTTNPVGRGPAESSRWCGAPVVRGTGRARYRSCAVPVTRARPDNSRDRGGQVADRGRLQQAAGQPDADEGLLDEVGVKVQPSPGWFN